MAMVLRLGDREPYYDYKLAQTSKVSQVGCCVPIAVSMVLASVAIRHVATWTWRALVRDGILPMDADPLPPDVQSPCSRLPGC